MAKQKIASIIATLFYLGHSRMMPGTIGALVAFPVYYLLQYGIKMFGIVLNIPGLGVEESLIVSDLVLSFFMTVLLFFIGLVAVKVYIAGKPDSDPQEVVVDELVGQMLVIVLTPVSMSFVLSSKIAESYPKIYLECLFLFLLPFGLFRFFDIVKPWPIDWLDRNVKGAFGVIIDDIAAAIMAIVVHFATVFFILDLYR